MTSAETQNFGNITISVIRVAPVKRSVPYELPKTSFKQTSQISEKIVEATGVSNAVRYS